MPYEPTNLLADKLATLKLAKDAAEDAYKAACAEFLALGVASLAGATCTVTRVDEALTQTLDRKALTLALGEELVSKYLKVSVRAASVRLTAKLKAAA